MQPILRLSSLSSLLGLCGLLTALTLPAQAQNTDPPPGYPNPGSSGPVAQLSDVSGPFLGNLNSGTTPLGSPLGSPVIRSISALDSATRDILLLPFDPDLNPISPLQLNLGPVLKVCVQLTASMDKLSPFAGCSDLNWKVYNRAVQDSKQLRRELSQAVKTQKTALATNPSPIQYDAIVQRLGLLEKTTTALETTNATLVALGQAMDKAR